VTKKRKDFKSKNRKNNLLPISILLLCLLVAESLLYTWCRIQYIQIGYEIVEKQKERERLLDLQRKLRIELAHLKSPERIRRIATKQLGLRIPDSNQIVVLP